MRSLRTMLIMALLDLDSEGIKCLSNRTNKRRFKFLCEVYHLSTLIPEGLDDSEFSAYGEMLDLAIVETEKVLDTMRKGKEEYEIVLKERGEQ